ncbi:hypothetical protein [Aeromicrobium sp. UC242_57]|uniref:Y-family DNA polymerase n=1 Tax=Aeromicrobium sp. UC242_57 TaxID=3374624 RepID=UPI003787C8ED
MRAASGRTMVLWAPDWPIVAVEAPATAPVAVLDKGQVLACSQVARAEGVRRGMRRRDAQSRSPGLILRDYNPDADARAFETVLAAIEAQPRGGAAATRAVRSGGSGQVLRGARPRRRPSSPNGSSSSGCGTSGRGWPTACSPRQQAARRALPQDSLVVQAGESGQFLRDLPIDTLGDAELVGLPRRDGPADLWGTSPACHRATSTPGSARTVRCCTGWRVVKIRDPSAAARCQSSSMPPCCSNRPSSWSSRSRSACVRRLRPS